MRVIVTGASGFVGREIVSELHKRNCEVFQIRNSSVNTEIPNAESFKIDITSFENLEKLFFLKEIDVIIHSAGLAHQFGKTGREKFQKVNVEGTRNILRLAVALKIRRFILISSTAIYGNVEQTKAKKGTIDELTICQPQTFYAESKLEAERSAIEFCEKNNINLTIFRLAPVIGEGNTGNLARMIETIDKNRFVWIGAGENYKSLIYKSDVGRACGKVLTSQKKGAEIFNLSAEPIKMKDLVTATAKILNKKIPRVTISPKIFEIFFLLNRKTLKIEKLQKISLTIEKWLSDDVYSAELFARAYDFKIETTVLEGLSKQIGDYQRKKGSR